jgi:hypothetical protein
MGVADAYYAKWGIITPDHFLIENYLKPEKYAEIKEPDHGILQRTHIDFISNLSGVSFYCESGLPVQSLEQLSDDSEILFYHATADSLAKKAKRDGTLYSASRLCTKFCPDSDPNYVYITDDFVVAANWALRNVSYNLKRFRQLVNEKSTSECDKEFVTNLRRLGVRSIDHEVILAFYLNPDIINLEPDPSWLNSYKVEKRLYLTDPEIINITRNY